MENKPFISGAATSGDLKATTMRKSSSSLNRLREKCKDYLVSVLIFILLLCLLILFRCKSRNVNPEKPDVPLNKNDAFQKVQKRRVQEKR